MGYLLDFLGALGTPFMIAVAAAVGGAAIGMDRRGKAAYKRWQRGELEKEDVLKAQRQTLQFVLWASLAAMALGVAVAWL